MNLINNLVEIMVESTKALDLNTEEEIKRFIQGEIDYAYKCDLEVTPEKKRTLANALDDTVIRERFGKNESPKPMMKIYITRDRADYEDEQQENFVRKHPEKETKYGRIRLFYEKPELNRKTGVWECAREAAPIKNYMFPQIKCEECAEFVGPELSEE